MTDGQSFYLVLAIFYLIECVKFAPPGSIGLVSRFGGFGNCSPRPPFMTAWGIKKAVFLAPILPWPGSIYLLAHHAEAKPRARRIALVSSVRHHHRFLRLATSKLSALATLNLLNFFAVLPFLYVRAYEEKTILYALGYSYALLVLTAIHYRALHKRLFPSHKADRFKTTLYTALLPWHAARCCDEIYLSAAQRWHPVAALAANAQNQASLAQLQQHWRNANYLSQPTFSRADLAEAFRQAGLDPTRWQEARSDLESPRYCPCCLNGYEARVTHCADCHGVALKQE